MFNFVLGIVLLGQGTEMLVRSRKDGGIGRYLGGICVLVLSALNLWVSFHGGKLA